MREFIHGVMNGERIIVVIPSQKEEMNQFLWTRFLKVAPLMAVIIWPGLSGSGVWTGIIHTRMIIL